MPRTPLTLLELLESLEAAVAARQGQAQSAPVTSPSLALREESKVEVNWSFPNENANVLPPGVLRSQMEKAGLTETEFSAIFGISPGILQEWLGGLRPVPSWVLPTIQMLYLLSPAVRQRLFQDHPVQQAIKQQPELKQLRSHPFSRIEDL